MRHRKARWRAVGAGVPGMARRAVPGVGGGGGGLQGCWMLTRGCKCHWVAAASAGHVASPAEPPSAEQRPGCLSILITGPTYQRGPRQQAQRLRSRPRRRRALHAGDKPGSRCHCRALQQLVPPFPGKAAAAGDGGGTPSTRQQRNAAVQRNAPVAAGVLPKAGAALPGSGWPVGGVPLVRCRCCMTHCRKWYVTCAARHTHTHTHTHIG